MFPGILGRCRISQVLVWTLWNLSLLLQHQQVETCLFFCMHVLPHCDVRFSPLQFALQFHGILVKHVRLWFGRQQHNVLVIQIHNISLLSCMSVCSDDLRLEFVSFQPSLVALRLWIFAILKVTSTFRCLQNSYLRVKQRTMQGMMLLATP